MTYTVTSPAAYLLDVLLLFLLQGQLNEYLLELLVAVVNNELFKTVLLQKSTFFENLFFLPFSICSLEYYKDLRKTYLKHFKSIDIKDTHDLCP